MNTSLHFETTISLRRILTKARRFSTSAATHQILQVLLRIMAIQPADSGTAQGHAALPSLQAATGTANTAAGQQ